MKYKLIDKNMKYGLRILEIHATTEALISLTRINLERLIKKFFIRDKKIILF